MFRRLAAVILSVVLLSPGWLGMTGLTLPFAMIPLLWISASYDQTRRSWWRMFGWAALTFALWNISTVWWIWNATPVGPVAATLASTTLNMIAFMLFHTVAKKGPKTLAYTLLIAGWIATEYWYTVVGSEMCIRDRRMARAMVRIHGCLRRFAVGAAL